VSVYICHLVGVLSGIVSVARGQLVYLLVSKDCVVMGSFHFCDHQMDYFSFLIFFVRKGLVLELVSYSVVSVLIRHAFIPVPVYLSVRCSPAAVFTAPSHLVFCVRPWPQRMFFSPFLLLFVWKGHILLISRRVLDRVSLCHPLCIHATICRSTICFIISVAAAFLPLLQNSTLISCNWTRR
jgi:hypothetical protein